MQPGGDVAFGADGRQPADEPFDGPQQDLHLHLGARTGLGQVASDPGANGEQQGGRLGVLDVNRLRAEVFGLLVADPRDQRVDIGVRGHIGRNHPQRRAEPGVVAVEPRVERQTLVIQP